MRSALRAGCCAALGGLALAAAPGAGASGGDCVVRPAAAQEASMMRMIVSARRAAKVPVVRGSIALRRVGRVKSLSMARGGSFSHSRGLPWARGRAGGQNIAMAASARAAFRAMLRSRMHRANILAGEWRHAAVGAARSCDRQVYFTVNFLGARAR